MQYPAKRDPNRLRIYHEGRKRRLRVGELIYHPVNNQYEFVYDDAYRYAKNVISLGPKLSLAEEKHYSNKGCLFPFFLDRIPDKENPAYPDYCASQGISVDEKNLIILLGSIGRRGPSSFVFESVYETGFTSKDIAAFREALNLTQYDFATAFSISFTTLQRLEAEKSADVTSLRLIEVFLNFPEVALWQLAQSGGKLHRDAKVRLKRYFLGLNAIA